MQKTAIIIGATGLTGSLVLEQLLNNPAYTTIKLFSRKQSGIQHPKVQEFVGDLLHFENFAKDFTGDEVYCCIGTTKKKTPDREQYKAIDIGIPVNAAQLAKQNGVQTFAVVSAIGADANSSVPYNRIKGEMEKGVMEADIAHTYILRPSMIAGNRKEHRGGEKFAIGVFMVFNFMIPKKYRMVEASAIAKRMIALCDGRGPSCVVESKEIWITNSRENQILSFPGAMLVSASLQTAPLHVYRCNLLAQ